MFYDVVGCECVRVCVCVCSMKGGCELDEISTESAIVSPGALSNAATMYPVHIIADYSGAMEDAVFSEVCSALYSVQCEVCSVQC